MLLNFSFCCNANTVYGRFWSKVYLATLDNSYCNTVYVVHIFLAICKFTQFRNCAVQIRNYEIANQFQNGNPISNRVALLCILEIVLFVKQTTPMEAIIARSARLSV